MSHAWRSRFAVSCDAIPKANAVSRGRMIHHSFRRWNFAQIVAEHPMKSADCHPQRLGITAERSVGWAQNSILVEAQAFRGDVPVKEALQRNVCYRIVEIHISENAFSRLGKNSLLKGLVAH